MRNVDEVSVAKDIRQAVLANVRPTVRHYLRRPEVPPPGTYVSTKKTRKMAEKMIAASTVLTWP